MSELSSRRRWGILAICCLSLFIVSLDTTIVNVALPSIEQDLHASVSNLAWIVDAYLIVLAGLLMFSGSMADRFGRRRVFQLGLALFGTGSLLCGLAPGPGLLIAFRALQAVGGSMLNPVAVSIISNVFTDRRERMRAMGVWAAIFGLGMAVGPVLGGALVSGISWRAIFLVNLPVVLAAIVLTAVFVPESRAGITRRLDPVAQVAVVVLFASLTYGIIEGPDAGWGSARIVTAFALSAVALVTLVVYEPRRDQPMVDLRFFRSVPFAGATIAAVCTFIAFGMVLFLNTFYLQQARGLSPVDAGIRTLPMALMIVIAAPVSSRLAVRSGTRLPLLLGGAGIAVSAAMFLQLSDTTSYAWLFGCYIVFGAGYGLLNAPITNTAVSSMPLSQAGVAGAIASTARQLGQSLGVALAGVITAGVGGDMQEFAAKSHTGWWIVGVAGIAVMVIAILSTGAWARRTAQKVRDELGDVDGPLRPPAT